MAYPTHGNEYHERQPWKQSCRAATTANITISTALNNADTLDGVTLATGDRVLVKNQSTGAQNGIYIVGVTPARSVDFSASSEIVGSVVVVTEGTANADTAWNCTTTAPITVGTTALVFAAFGGGSATVTSVALTVPAEFSLSGSPITTSGTLAITKANESANTVWAGPTSGGAAAPAFRALVAADIPAGVGAVHEVVMVTSSSPPDPVLTSDGLDWIYSS